MKRLYLLAALAVTYWQIRAGIARCGTIDGGVLILPLLIATGYLVRGVSRDLKYIFGRDLDEQRNTTTGHNHYIDRAAI